MTKTGLIFIGVTWLAGIVAGIVEARSPGLMPIPIPHLMVPVVVGLLVDIALRPMGESGRMPPLTMNQRAVGVIGGGLVSLVAAALAGG